MKVKTIIQLTLVILFTSCINRTWKKEKIIHLDYKVEGFPVFYETKYAMIKFNKSDVIKNLENFLVKDEQYDRRLFLEYLKHTNDTIRLKPDTIFSKVLDTVPKWDYDWGKEGDTIVLVPNRNDERNYYTEPMFWSAYDLIREGKCEITSKLDSSKVNRFRIVYNHVPINTKYTEFIFENDTIFFDAVTQLGL